MKPVADRSVVSHYVQIYLTTGSGLWVLLAISALCIAGCEQKAANSVTCVSDHFELEGRSATVLMVYRNENGNRTLGPLLIHVVPDGSAGQDLQYAGLEYGDGAATMADVIRGDYRKAIPFNGAVVVFREVSGTCSVVAESWDPRCITDKGFLRDYVEEVSASQTEER